MSDKFSPEVRSRVMAAIKQKNTKLELLVFRGLSRRGISFQKHYRGVIGTPDICLPRKKIAVFIDGDFWHGYRFPQWRSRIKSSYWRDKIERNRKRDLCTFRVLRRSGWRVLRIWEHEVKNGLDPTLDRIRDFILNS